MRSCEFFGDVQTIQQHGGVGFRRVAVFIADHAFQFAQPHAVGIAQLGLFVDTVPLFERAPKRLVAHDHSVDHAIGIERKLVLP